jgi:hypothetical protein
MGRHALADDAMPRKMNAQASNAMTELNQMLTIAGGILIAGAIAFIFFLGWTLTTARFSTILLRLIGLILMAAIAALAFWLVFMRTGVLTWSEMLSMAPGFPQP